MDVGTLLLMLGISYGLGVLWYDLLPATVPEKVWRTAAYPFVGIFVSEAAIAPFLTFDVKFGGIHVLTALIGSLIGVIVDWLIAKARHPRMVAQVEARAG